MRWTLWLVHQIPFQFTVRKLGLSASAAVRAISRRPLWDSPAAEDHLTQRHASFSCGSQSVAGWCGNRRHRAFSAQLGMTLKSQPSSIAPRGIHQACLCACVAVWPLCPLLLPRLSSTGVDLKNTHKHCACQTPSWNLLFGEPTDPFILQVLLALQFNGKKCCTRIKQNDIYIQLTQFTIYRNYLNILILSFFISKMGIIISTHRCFHGG